EALENCGEVLTEICTCGCEGTCNYKEKQLEDSSLESLTKYEREIENELRHVRDRIKELKSNNK
ncbi:MAG: hypothetical protein P8X80_09025, partial [Desulfobacterales bacterium]